MQFRITIDIFSGRKNPVLEIKGREAERIFEHLRPAQPVSRMLPVPSSSLGYRGLIIEASGARGLPRVFRMAHGDLMGPKLRHRAADTDFEEFLVRESGLLRRLKLGRDFPAFLLKEIERFRGTREKCKHRPPHWPRREHCHCAPLYEPAWWNDSGQKQFGNNCYNYSTNYRSDTFAQPGLAAGAETRP